MPRQHETSEPASDLLVEQIDAGNAALMFHLRTDDGCSAGGVYLLDRSFGKLPFVADLHSSQLVTDTVSSPPTRYRRRYVRRIDDLDETTMCRVGCDHQDRWLDVSGLLALVDRLKRGRIPCGASLLVPAL